MAGKTTTLYARFKRQVLSIERTRKTCEKLFLNEKFKIEDIDLLYGGLFLEMFMEFERLIENLFVGLVSGDLYSPTQKIKRKFRCVPKRYAKDMIYNGKPYLDWFPYHKTKEKAKRYFDSDEPFDTLTENELENLADYYKIRNVLAHKSDKAKNDFLRIIPNSLSPIERTPTGYLRSRPSTTNQTQFEIAIVVLIQIANKLSK